MKKTIEKLLDKGLFHILGSSVINKVIGLVTNIFVVKALSKIDFGIYSFAYNIISIFLLLSGLGLANGALQYCSEKRPDSEKNSIYKFTLGTGMLINLLITLVVFIYSRFVPLAIPEGKTALTLLSFLPAVDYIYTFILLFLRSQKENKKYAFLTNINSVGMLFFSISGSFFGGVAGTIIGRYLAYIVSIIYAIYTLIPSLKEILNAVKPELNKRIAIFKYSLVTCANNGISQMLYLLDVLLIGLYIKDADIIASYKSATTIPFALQFIPMSVIIFIYPYFAAHLNDKIWLRTNTKKVIIVLGSFNALISICLYQFAPLIIRIFYGERYMDSLAVFRVLVVSYFFSATFKIPCGNILAMMRKIGVNFIISIIAGAATVIFDILLISNYGSIGAAYTNLAVTLLSSIYSFVYLGVSSLQKTDYS